MRWPVSVKGVVLDQDGCVLLGMNDRDEWELLGGRLESGESPEETVRRELHEEAGIRATPLRLVRTWVFEPLPGTEVLIVTYGCRLEAGAIEASPEHSQVRFHDADTLDGLALPDGYRTDIRSWQHDQARA